VKPSRRTATRGFIPMSTSTLEVILSLTRELGVNLAGVEIILNMREKMNQMQTEFERFFEYLRTHADEFRTASQSFRIRTLIPISRIIKSVMNIKKRSKDKFRFVLFFPFLIVFSFTFVRFFTK
jgi:MerR family transcriptional regulator/heat shock protein HspR